MRYLVTSKTRRRLQRTQLVVSERVGNKEVFAANAEHPHAATMRALVASDAPAAPPPRPRKDDQRLRRRLATLGAPLAGVAPLKVAPPAAPSEVVETLVRGAALARRDATVARSLPLCFWRLRDSLDVKALAALAARPEDKHTVGFFLELAGELGGDRRLAGMAELLRDRRRRSVHDFFLSPSGRGEAARDFPLAARWGFRMNMDLTSFRALFVKSVRR